MGHFMKKMAALAVGGLIVTYGISSAADFITIGSGGVGGTYYPLGGAMAEVLTNAGIDVKATSRSTAASKENCRLLARGRAQIGMVMGSTLWQAYNGVDAFAQDGKLPLRTLMNMYAAPQHIVTTSETGIRKFEDLKGKRVSVGAPGGGDQVLTMLILKAAGWDPEKDIQKQQLSQPEGATALVDGHVDAVFWNFAAPGSAVLEVGAVRHVVLVPIPEDVVKKVCEDNPFLFRYVIEKGVYPEQTEDVLTIADGNYLVVNESMNPDLSFKLVKTIIEHQKDFMQVTPLAEHFNPKESSVGIIPFSTGAVKYFKEQGYEVMQ
ncbi:TRAP transporter solute receptor, TAXI family [Jonquetella anthropi DSM 22815]|uniref:TRAP transporter solute receptor, TAXI family n=1 Tax=Jonquetella anthropi DSM 22815 TaxID=885272 RepID=H0UMF9_9BACT|nr:TAXI family TRAP transporter solute-binding subunit [Jonquetella anthropi]EEX47660.1 TRAP transporter solute receptor, TAXI family [Jonquetella anthropi E3_33 E1]EHM12632.1 TRAP transporter solute receptor, TAXI family [Jonquetella anthropi DSM 22815]